MADPSRPPAPFLPPEIIAPILEFIHPKQLKHKAAEHPEFAAISRISSAWKTEAQKRLFEVVEIRSEDELSKLVDIIQAGLGRFILLLSLIRHRTVDSHHVYLLLSSVPNLKFFSWFYPKSDRFSREDEASLQSNTVLPHLVALQLRSTTTDWSREVFEPIIGTSKVVELEIDGYQTYEGPLWSSPLPSTLKILRLSMQSDVLFGKIWKYSQFKNLEILKLNRPMWIDTPTSSMTRVIPFFEVIGPSLLELEALSFDLYDLPTDVFQHLAVLKTLSISDLGRDVNVYLSHLPPSLVKLSISQVDIRNSPILATSINHLANLSILRINVFVAPIDLSLLPGLVTVEILKTFPQEIMESLSALNPTTSLITELVLGNYFDTKEPLTTNLEIIDRCKELGITLRYESD